MVIKSWRQKYKFHKWNIRHNCSALICISWCIVCHRGLSVIYTLRFQNESAVDTLCLAANWWWWTYFISLIIFKAWYKNSNFTMLFLEECWWNMLLLYGAIMWFAMALLSIKRGLAAIRHGLVMYPVNNSAASYYLYATKVICIKQHIFIVIKI